MEINEISVELKKKSIEDQLKTLAKLFPSKVVFTTSFGIEDQVISHIIFTNDIPIEVVTLDTGRLFQETYTTFNKTINKYHKKIKTYFPDNVALEKMMTEKGPFSFYSSKENRIECCTIRKVVQLNKALGGMECWISGIRSDQSENRGQMNRLEPDEKRKLVKFYPLFDWSYQDVWDFIRENNVPYNVLHDRGFVSIGCQPCTRAVAEGENFRSGRWWWENNEKKECGLHSN